MMNGDAKTSGTNWKNVNNWHWVEKNCLPWAQEFLGKKLLNFNVEKENMKVWISAVNSVTGDVDLNQRKGKVINIYDLVLKLEWKGSLDDDVIYKGSISCPEWMHDSDSLEWEVSMESWTRETDSLLQMVKKSLCPLMESYLLTEFSKDLMSAHTKDIIIPKESMTGHPTLEVYSPKPPVLTTEKDDKSQDNKVKGSLITLKQSIEFMCSASDLYDALVNPNKIAVWTRGSVIAKPGIGESFSLFHGNITGVWKELVEPTKLVFTWRLSSWPVGHESIVTITLKQGSDSTMLNLSQENVPIGIKELTESNWKSYYWNAIMGTFGYGANF